VGPPELRGDAAIGEAVVVEVLVGELQRRLGPEQEGHRRVEAVAGQLAELAIGARILEEAVQPEEGAVADAVADIEGQALVAELAAAGRHLAHAKAVRLLEDAVDDAASAAAAEDQRVRALQHLDAVDVVEVAVVLH
ncbi:hypothetical protein QU38_00895, partial [Staphylococcus aureus]